MHSRDFEAQRLAYILKKQNKDSPIKPVRKVEVVKEERKVEVVKKVEPEVDFFGSLDVVVNQHYNNPQNGAVHSSAFSADPFSDPFAGGMQQMNLNSNQQIQQQQQMQNQQSNQQQMQQSNQSVAENYASHPANPFNQFKPQQASFTIENVFGNSNAVYAPMPPSTVSSSGYTSNTYNSNGNSTTAFTPNANLDPFSEKSGGQARTDSFSNNSASSGPAAINGQPSSPVCFWFVDFFRERGCLAGCMRLDHRVCLDRGIAGLLDPLVHINHSDPQSLLSSNHLDLLIHLHNNHSDYFLLINKASITNKTGSPEIHIQQHTSPRHLSCKTQPNSRLGLLFRIIQTNSRLWLLS